MAEFEPSRKWEKILVAPSDHPGMQIHPEVATWRRTLLHQLTGEPSATATEVEHLLIRVGRYEVEDRPAGWIVERSGVGRANELPHLQGRDGYLSGWRHGRR